MIRSRTTPAVGELPLPSQIQWLRRLHRLVAIVGDYGIALAAVSLAILLDLQWVWIVVATYSLTFGLSVAAMAFAANSRADGYR